MRLEQIVKEAYFTEVSGRDGLSYRVWRNPSSREFLSTIAQAPFGTEGMRCILDQRDLYFWQSTAVLHGDFVKQTAIDGVRVVLRANRTIAANLETIAAPEAFPWVFQGVNPDDLDNDALMAEVERWLSANPRLARIYPTGFTLDWYS